MLLESIHTLEYMIVGYTVFFGFILGYIVSLAIRFQRVQEKVSTYRSMLVLEGKS